MDLLLQLFNTWVKKNKPPDVLSIEKDTNNNSVIQFEWFDGRSYRAAYTKNRYNLIWAEFNSYWKPVCEKQTNDKLEREGRKDK